jgi:hypothetical protein
MEMYENDILAHPEYETYFPTFELKYLSSNRKHCNHRQLEDLEVGKSH